MKTKLLFAICIFFTAIASAQIENPVLKNEAGRLVEVIVTPPKFIGNKNATGEFQENNSMLIHDYFNSYLVYPSEALNRNIQGTQVVQFTVTTNGEVKNIMVVNSVSPEIDNEVVKVLSETNGMWSPGLNNGEPVEMEKEIATVFQIKGIKSVSGENVFKEKATGLFKKGSRAMISQNNPEKALKYFDKALKYLPYESTILNFRGMARYMIGDDEGARRDLDRVTAMSEKILVEKNPVLLTENKRN